MQLLSPQHIHARNDRGVALVLVFLVLVLVLGLTYALVSDTGSETVFTETSQNLVKSTYGAESGAALAENQLWNAYLNAQGGTPGLMPTYLAWLDGPSGIAWPGINMANEGQPGTGLQLFGAQSLDGRTNINNVEVWRNDAASGANTTLTIRSVGQDRFGNTLTLTDRVRVRGGSGGLDYAIMARDMSCIFCHTEVDNVGRYYNTSPGNYGTYDRVKVASLHTTMLRPGSTDSRMAGTFYARGNILNKDAGNTPMTAAQMQSSGLDAYTFDSSSNHYITQNGSGAMTQTDLIAAVPDLSGNYPAGENLYLDYPANPTAQTDGYLPDDIAPMFTDLNGNRIVDSAEVAARMDDVNNDYGYRRAGSISGGVIYDVPIGSTYSSGSLPGASNTTSIDSSADGVHTGNVILTGTEANPLLLDDTVVIDGDVIIQGVVKGMGQIYATGNIYVTGDITHQTGSEYGYASDGTETGLMLKAGGNIMINDYMSKEWTSSSVDNPNSYDTGNHLTNSGQWSFSQEQATLFNRLEWQKTQQYLPDANGNPVLNSTYDPTYVPKYTVMHEGDPVYIFAQRYQTGWWGGYRGAYWDDAAGVWKGDERPDNYDVHEDKNLNGVLDPGEDIDGDGQLDTGDLIMLDAATVTAQGGATVAYAPKNSWISDSNLKQFWINDHNQRQDGEPIHVQAGMETDSTIFVLARNKARYDRKYDGKVVVDGMIVANNVGMLAQNGLRVNYDGRYQDFDAGDGSQAPVIWERLARQYQ